MTKILHAAIELDNGRFLRVFPDGTFGGMIMPGGGWDGTYYPPDAPPPPGVAEVVELLNTELGKEPVA